MTQIPWPHLANADIAAVWLGKGVSGVSIDVDGCVLEINSEVGWTLILSSGSVVYEDDWSEQSRLPACIGASVQTILQTQKEIALILSGSPIARLVIALPGVGYEAGNVTWMDRTYHFY